MTNPEDPNRVLIFDTTLRDGEQSPGISLNTQEKLEIAAQLARLGVDVIEAGFPITSPGDFEAVQAISRTDFGTPVPPVITGLARTHVADIDAAWNAVKDAERPRIHVFISTSDIHIEYQLQTARDEGATTINIPDTVGYTMPHEYTAYLEKLYELIPDLRNAILSVHCHD